MIEEWRPVVGYEDIYSVSSFGRVRRDVAAKTRRAGGIRAYSALQRGYAVIALTRGGKTLGYQVHRLVMAAFVGPCPPRLQVNHKNGVKHDNRLENLEYVTQSENLLHAIRTGLKPIIRGDAHGRSVLSEEKIRSIRKLVANGHQQKDVAFLFDVSNGHVCEIVSGKKWAHVPEEVTHGG